MSLIDTIQATFAAEGLPAVPIRQLNDRIRALGSACSSETISRELRAAPEAGLRTLGSEDPVLERISATCFGSEGAIGLETLVVDGGRRGLRPTPADAVRVLGRHITPRSRAARARWSRLLGQLEDRPMKRPD